MADWVKGICDVCLLLDENAKQKDVYWCDTCKAWICRKCEFNFARRGQAMLARKRVQEKLRAVEARL